MTTYRSYNRAARLARLVVFSCCAAFGASGLAFAQSNASTVNFRDAKLTMGSASNAQNSQLSDKVAIPSFKTPASARATQISATQPASQPSKIKQVSASTPAKRVLTTSAKPKAIRQAQYAQAKNTAPYAQSLSEIDMDKPFEDKCPDPRSMPSILDIPYKVVPSPGAFPENCPLPEEDFHRKAPTPITFTWKASSLCHKPLYFEDVQLERYGHYCHPLLQPICSRVRFWLTIPCLPYLMGVNPPSECVYDLGYYRPGNCAPSMIEPIPISLRGGLYEAGAIVGVAALIP